MKPLALRLGALLVFLQFGVSRRNSGAGFDIQLTETRNPPRSETSFLQLVEQLSRSHLESTVSLCRNKGEAPELQLLQYVTHHASGKLLLQKTSPSRSCLSVS